MKRPTSDWTDLFRAFRMSLDPRKLWLAFKGIIVTLVLVGLLLAVLAGVYHARGVRFTREPAPRPWSGDTVVRRRPASHVVAGGGIEVLDTDVWGAVRRLHVRGAVQATQTFAWALPCAACCEVCEAVAEGLPWRHALVRVMWISDAAADLLLVGLMCGFVLLLIWSYYGGAILRIGAVEYGLDERIELRSAAAYAWRKHHCFYGGPLGLITVLVAIAVGLLLAGLVGWNLLVMVVLAAGLLGAVVAAAKVRDAAGSAWAGLGAGAGGLVLTIVVCCLLVIWGVRVGYVGEVVLGVLSPLAFVGGLLAAILGIWLVFGTWLMFGTVATTDADTFEGWSRSFHYLFLHPWRYAFYSLVMLAHGAACLGFVYVVRLLTEWATLLPLSAGLLGRFESVYQVMTGQAAGASAADVVLAFFLRADSFVLDLVFLCFVVAYFCSARSIAYLLLRKVADGTPISEVHLEPRDRALLEPAPAGEAPGEG